MKFAEIINFNNIIIAISKMLFSRDTHNGYVSWLGGAHVGVARMA